MGGHEGQRSGRGAIDSRRFGLLSAGITLTVVAWGVLVWAAIDFGASARDGSGLAWLFLAFATIGATACLFLSLSLGVRVLAVLRGEPDRPRTPGGKRAAR